MVKKCRKSSEVILANGVQKFSFVDVMIYIVLGLLVVTMVVPFMNIISISLSDYTSVVSDKTMLIPKNLNFSAYKIIFNVEVYRAFFLTAFVTVANTTLHIILCMMAAYPLAKKELPGRKVMFIYVPIPRLIRAIIAAYMRHTTRHKVIPLFAAIPTELCIVVQTMARQLTFPH